MFGLRDAVDGIIRYLLLVVEGVVRSFVLHLVHATAGVRAFLRRAEQDNVEFRVLCFTGILVSCLILAWSTYAARDVDSLSEIVIRSTTFIGFVFLSYTIFFLFSVVSSLFGQRIWRTRLGIRRIQAFLTLQMIFFCCLYTLTSNYLSDSSFYYVYAIIDGDWKNLAVLIGINLILAVKAGAFFWYHSKVSSLSSILEATGRAISTVVILAVAIYPFSRYLQSFDDGPNIWSDAVLERSIQVKVVCRVVRDGEGNLTASIQWFNPAAKPAAMHPPAFRLGNRETPMQAIFWLTTTEIEKAGGLILAPRATNTLTIPLARERVQRADRTAPDGGLALVNGLRISPGIGTAAASVGDRGSAAARILTQEEQQWSSGVNLCSEQPFG